jgi:1,2-diacylglycerol 3-beta-galactosyltransferase
VRVLNHCHFPIQLAIVAGGDHDSYQQLQTMEWHVPTHLYQLVDNMPQLLRASDMLACKAGGLIVTEGLAVGIPLLLFDAIEGQETGNVEYVVENGAGTFTRPSLELLEKLHDWFVDDFELLTTLAGRARQIGFPRSSFDIAQKVYSYAIGESLVPLSRGAVRVRHARLQVQEWRDWLNKLFQDSSL